MFRVDVVPFDSGEWVLILAVNPTAESLSLRERVPTGGEGAGGARCRGDTVP
jgi:hypothetical protein